MNWVVVSNSWLRDKEWRKKIRDLFSFIVDSFGELENLRSISVQVGGSRVEGVIVTVIFEDLGEDEELMERIIWIESGIRRECAGFPLSFVYIFE